MSFSNVLLYSRPGRERFVPEISQTLGFRNDGNSGIHEVDGRGMLGRFSREQHYLCLGLIEGEAFFGGNIGNHFALVSVP